MRFWWHSLSCQNVRRRLSEEENVFVSEISVIIRSIHEFAELIFPHRLHTKCKTTAKSRWEIYERRET
jgi:hypothetical protein